jgi:hypothetical protein
VSGAAGVPALLKRLQIEHARVTGLEEGEEFRGLLAELGHAIDAITELAEAAKQLGQRASKDRAGLRTVYSTDTARLAAATAAVLP